MDIRESILHKLTEIEQQENVVILHAVESGSRAWGFASPDSDYDVRFIYVRRRDDYLRLGKLRDVIEWQLDDVYDLNGWDLQKAMRLLHGSNPTLLEWCNSPVIYRTTDWFDSVRQAADDYFSQRAGLWHYLSMAKHNYHAYLEGDKVRLKKYFYVLRPILACRWILTRGTPPPVAFSALTETVLADELQQPVADLVAVKMQTSELGEGDRIPVLHAYILRSLTEIEAAAAALPQEQPKTWAALDALFLDALSRGTF